MLVNPYRENLDPNWGEQVPGQVQTVAEAGEGFSRPGADQEEGMGSPGQEKEG
jgi:hypothetical protein